jgi:hypothetical protein
MEQTFDFFCRKSFVYYVFSLISDKGSYSFFYPNKKVRKFFYLPGRTFPDVHLFLVIDGVAVRDVELQHVDHVLE